MWAFEYDLSMLATAAFRRNRARTWLWGSVYPTGGETFFDGIGLFVGQPGILGPSDRHQALAELLQSRRQLPHVGDRVRFGEMPEEHDGLSCRHDRFLTPARMCQASGEVQQNVGQERLEVARIVPGLFSADDDGLPGGPDRFFMPAEGGECAAEVVERPGQLRSGARKVVPTPSPSDDDRLFGHDAAFLGIEFITGGEVGQSTAESTFVPVRIGRGDLTVEAAVTVAVRLARSSFSHVRASVCPAKWSS